MHEILRMTYRSLIITPLIILGMVSCKQAKKQETIAENYKTEKFNGAIFPSTYTMGIGKFTDRFTPTHEEIDLAESAIAGYIKSNSNAYPFINDSLSHYRRQYFGYKDQEGNKILHMSFFLSTRYQINNSWLDNYLIVLDGGNKYWQVNVNLDTKSVFNFKVNWEG